MGNTVNQTNTLTLRSSARSSNAKTPLGHSRRLTKTPINYAEDSDEDGKVAAADAPPRKRGRPRKFPEVNNASGGSNDSNAVKLTSQAKPGSSKTGSILILGTPRKRGRPRKNPVVIPPPTKAPLKLKTAKISINSHGAVVKAKNDEHAKKSADVKQEDCSNIPVSFGPTSVDTAVLDALNQWPGKKKKIVELQPEQVVINADGTKTYLCTQCPTVFSSRACLIRHIRIHTGM